jgi:hypothetical protein
MSRTTDRSTDEAEDEPELLAIPIIFDRTGILRLPAEDEPEAFQELEGAGLEQGAEVPEPLRREVPDTLPEYTAEPQEWTDETDTMPLGNEFPYLNLLFLEGKPDITFNQEGLSIGLLPVRALGGLDLCRYPTCQAIPHE